MSFKAFFAALNNARLVGRIVEEPAHPYPKFQKLKPVRDRESYHKPLAEELYALWYYIIYKPILDILQGNEVRQNARASLIRAVGLGKIQYKGGFFYGPFNASVSKGLREVGAIWDKTRRAFKLALRDMPLDLREAIASGKEKEREILHKVKLRIDHAQDVLNRVDYDFSELFQATINKADDQFNQSVKGKMTTPPAMSAAAAKKLAQAYSENLKPYVKGWGQDAIGRLRGQVTVNVVEGFRSEELIEQIRAQAGVTKRKAQFLARQETSMLVSKFREERYKDVGIREYEWSTSGDERTRPDHKALDGKVFSYTNPPVVDRATGRRGNPGEDFGCRCVAIPVFREGK